MRGRLALRAPSPRWVIGAFVVGLAGVALKVVVALFVLNDLAGEAGRGASVGLAAGDPRCFRGWLLAEMLLLSGVAPALSEELLYRACCSGGCADRFGTIVALTVSTLVFGLGHRSVGVAGFATAKRLFVACRMTPS